MEKEFDLKPKDVEGVTLYQGEGCENCMYSGYKGRSAIYEILLMNSAIKDLVLQRASTEKVRHRTTLTNRRQR